MTTESLITRLRTPSVWVHHESYSTPEPAGHERDSAPFEAADVMAMQARQIQEQAEEIERLRTARQTNLPDDEHPYTYASTQATNCACCGKYKHTPLRIDAMDGYVCLTCIDQKLGSLFGEFGYPEQPERKPMSDAKAYALAGAVFPHSQHARALELIRDVESHHKIGPANG